MKLQFDKNQEYQLDAIQSIVDLFEGQTLNTSDFEFSFSDIGKGSLQFTESGVANNLILSEEELLVNLNKIQTKMNLEKMKFRKE
jgi:type III restriction enzyme